MADAYASAGATQTRIRTAGRRHGDRSTAAAGNPYFRARPVRNHHASAITVAARGRGRGHISDVADSAAARAAIAASDSARSIAAAERRRRRNYRRPTTQSSNRMLLDRAIRHLYRRRNHGHTSA